MLDSTEMRAFQVREETGELPDEVYYLTDEDDPYDPEQQEVRALVIEQYAVTNQQRRDRRAQIRISVLEQALTDAGIEIPE